MVAFTIALVKTTQFMTIKQITLLNETSNFSNTTSNSTRMNKITRRSESLKSQSKVSRSSHQTERLIETLDQIESCLWLEQTANLPTDSYFRGWYFVEDDPSK